MSFFGDIWSPIVIHGTDERGRNIKKRFEADQNLKRARSNAYQYVSPVQEPSSHESLTLLMLKEDPRVPKYVLCSIEE